MTLLISIFAAIISTVIWYKNEHARKMRVGILCLMFWAASIMWFIDAIFEYAEIQAAYFTPEPADMLNDIFLGFSVVALALIIWLIIVLIKDPDGVVKDTLKKISSTSYKGSSESNS